MLLKLWDAKTGRILFTALIFLMVLAFLIEARGTITLFLFAVFFAYLVDPIVSGLQKPLRGRGKAILAFYLLFAGVLVGSGFLVGPRIVEEGRSLIGSLPSLLGRMSSGQFIVSIAHNEGWDQAGQYHIQQFVMSHRNEILNYTEQIVGELKAPLYHVWWLILIPILSIFFLKNGSRIAQSLVNLGRGREHST
jgi:predicted PurR-regulated permease PerM